MFFKLNHRSTFFLSVRASSGQWQQPWLPLCRHNEALDNCCRRSYHWAMQETGQSTVTGPQDVVFMDQPPGQSSAQW